MSAVTVTLSPTNYPKENIPPINIGDKIGGGKATEKAIKKQIRSKLMVYRLKRKVFKPRFIVTAVFHDLDSWRLHMKPYNF